VSRGLADLPKDEGIKVPDGAVEELSSVKASYRGGLVSELRHFALRSYGDKCKQVKDIPVALLPISDLNGCAIQTPRNGAVILLDSGGIFSLAALARYYFALWDYTGLPTFRDANWTELVSAVHNLARFCVTGDYTYVSQGLAAESRIDPPLTRKRLVDPEGQATFYMWTFILLHEYGHVELGHLKTTALRSLRIGSGTEIRYSPSQRQEFEADKYAYSHLAKTIPNFAAFAAGLLLNFFHLCEEMSTHKSSTHPPAIDRWKAIKTIAGVDRNSENLASDLEETFAEIREVGLSNAEQDGQCE